MMRMLSLLFGSCKTQRLQTFVRFLTSSQASEALRPFFFAVHPDFFGQHPKERAINQASLQTLSSYLESLFGSCNANPTTVKFYLRHQLHNSRGTVQKEDGASLRFRAVTINLFSRDVQSTVSQILNTCHLETDHLKSLFKKDGHQPQAFPRPIKWDDSYYAYTNKQNTQDAVPPRHKMVKQTLGSWLAKNRQRALDRLAKSQLIREDAETLRSELCKNYRLRDVRWESDWNVGAFRMSLSSIRKILQENPSYSSYIEGKELIFSSMTGICKEGCIILSNEAVPQYWSRVLEHLPHTLQQMNHISTLEQVLSSYLGNISISRKKYFHRIIIEDYAIYLQKLTSNFKVYNSSKRRWKEGRLLLPNSMRELKLVIEGIIGHLALTVSGELVLPASTQPHDAISFLLKNKKKCLENVQCYPRLQTDRKRLLAECIREYRLNSLEVDVSLTDDQVHDCLHKLLDNQRLLCVSMHDLRLRISRYYSVLRDGEVCIPWDLQI